MMAIPTEPIGSIPRTPELLEALRTHDGDDASLEALYEDAIRDTIDRFEETGSPVIIDGEQGKFHNFWTYPVHGMPNSAPDGFTIPFSAGHDRILTASDFIPVAQLGTTDDCGFSRFCDDTTTSRDTAFRKIRARVLGNELASGALGAG